MKSTSPIAKAAASAKLAPPFGGKQAMPFGKKSGAAATATGKQPPEPKLDSIISSLEAAVSREPDDADKRKLAQALRLVQDVNTSNSKAGN